jgi:predicted CopG family antitoxin
MGTKTIGVKDEVYERLQARKRDDESFTDLMDRLLDDTTADWRAGFGSLSADEAADLQSVVAAAREQTAAGMAARQQDAIERLAEQTDTDETA